MAEATEPKFHDIRKYPNRRYYDVTTRRHLTLEEVYALIGEGHDVRVTDSKTGEDITAAVLTQIILKLDVSKLQFFPVALLHRLIRTNEELVREFMEKYFDRALGVFMDTQRRMESQVRQTFGLPGEAPSVPGLGDWVKGPLNPFSPDFWAGGAQSSEGETADKPDGGSANVGAGEQAQAAFRGEFDALKAQIEALREELARRDGAEAAETGPAADVSQDEMKKEDRGT